MAGGQTVSYENPLLIEWIAEQLGFERLASILPWELYPPYLLVASGLFLDYVVVDSYKYSISSRRWLEISEE